MTKVARLLTLAAVVVSTMAVPTAGFAQTGLTVEASEVAACDTATFTILVSGGGGVYDLTWDFGDGETFMEAAVAAFPHSFDHAYPGSGDYTWMVMATDTATPELTGLTSGSVMIGPSVTLTSDIFPPILTLEAGQASLTFEAAVTGGESPYSYSWDLDGDGAIDAGSDSSSSTATFAYTAPGTYLATVTVTDNCGLTATGTLTVVVFDTDANACHPMAQRIAEAVDSLFPGQAATLYSCEDIFSFFTGGLTGKQLGFGRMWHAYQLAVSIEELTWEEILDWHLNGTGWGLLVQLDRFGEALQDLDTRQLYEMVMAGETTVKDIRTAVLAVVRYEADFEDALARLGEGATPGDLARFYRTAEDLGLEAAALDAYLDSGLSLTDLGHAGKLAERTGASLEEVVANHAAGYSWGEINKALRLADEENTVDEILAIGPLAFSQGQREERQGERHADQEARLAAQLAEQYGLTEEEALAVLATCSGNWACVRKELRNLQSTGAPSVQNDGTAERFARQFGVSVDQVWSVYFGSCDGDWTCVHKNLQDASHPGNGNGNGNGNGKKP
jgi:PKD repeat protein